MTKIVIVHPEMGIYLGNCLGLGFFSMLDCAGQDHAATFPTVGAARLHVIPWDENNDPDAYRYVEVDGSSEWASIEELEAAGLSEFTKVMRHNRLLDGAPAGRA